jgi:hypothetical protein
MPLAICRKRRSASPAACASSARRTVDRAIEALALDVLHDEPEALIVHDDGLQVDDVRVIDLPEDAALRERPRAHVGAVRQLGAHRFEHHVDVRVDVAREVHDAHAALAEQAHDRVFSVDHRACREALRGREALRALRGLRREGAGGRGVRALRGRRADDAGREVLWAHRRRDRRLGHRAASVRVDRRQIIDRPRDRQR